MNVSDAPSAPPFDPEQGASRNSMPCVASSADILWLSEGDMVLQSTIVNGPERPAAKPSGPRITSVDIFVFPTQRKTHSLCRATSAGVAQAVAPSLANCSAFPAECDHSA